MPRSRLIFATISTLLLPTACSTPPAASIQTTTISGSVLAPAGVTIAGVADVIGAGAGNVITAGSGNVITAGSGNLIGPAIARHVLALTEQPVAGADVYLANAAGTPYLNLPHGTTDSQGNYTIPNVPVGYPFMVATKVKTASGQDATLQTLTKSDTTLATPATLDAASTMVTNSVVTGGGALGDFNPAVFQHVTQVTQQALTPSSLPDLSNPQAMTAAMTQLAAQISDLQTSLSQLKSQLANIQASLDDLNQKIDQLAQQQQARAGNTTPAATRPQTTTQPLAPINPQPLPEQTQAPQTTQPGNPITPVPIVASPPPKNQPVTISGHLIDNGTSVAPVGNIPLSFDFQQPGASPEATVTTQADGSFSVPLHDNTGSAIQFWVVAETADGSAGLGYLTVNPDGSAQFQVSTDTAWASPYNITIP